MNAASAAVSALRELGVHRVYGLPGVHNLPLWSALRGSSVELVGVRHEQTAVYAADGHARATGTLGVALTTTGPGAANALGATGEAWASGSPVLVVATDIPAALRRPGVYRGVLHETRDQAGMYAPVVKATFIVGSPDELASTLVEAAALALQAPTGPTYVEVPTDFLSAEVSAATQPVAARSGAAASAPVPADADVARAAELVLAAERPLIWAGGGVVCGNAERELAQLAGRLGAPVIETYMSKGALAPDHPSWVGLPPHVPEAGRLWDDADLVLAVGTDFDAMMTQNWLQPAPPQLVAVNIDATDAGKAYTPDVALIGEAAPILARLDQALPSDLARTPASLGPARAAAIERLRDDAPFEVAFLEDLEAAVPADTAVVVDMCVAGYWIAAMRRFTRSRALAYPVGWGTLGFGFPASIGTALASPDAPALCVCGDGGFLFACGELAVVAEQRPRLTVLIVDDGGYGMLRYDQRHAGEEPYGVDLHTPDFVALTASFDVPARTVVPGADLRDALRASLAAAGPQVLVLQAELKPPPTTSPRWYRRG